MSAFTDMITAEIAATANGAPGCGHTCTPTCHGALVCTRAPHPTGAAGDTAPHATFGPDGLTQWTCP